MFMHLPQCSLHTILFNFFNALQYHTVYNIHMSSIYYFKLHQHWTSLNSRLVSLFKSPTFKRFYLRVSGFFFSCLHGNCQWRCLLTVWFEAMIDTQNVDFIHYPFREFHRAFQVKFINRYFELKKMRFNWI